MRAAWGHSRRIARVAKGPHLILAVDVPFVSSALLEYVVNRAKSAGATVTVPRAANGLQPLCAVYRRDFRNIAEKALRAGQYKIDALFDPAHTQILHEEELRSTGYSTEQFRNLNTPEDLAKARA
jgi:molybdopterin-guanine dinucleotide biosynthesis protein A